MSAEWVDAGTLPPDHRPVLAELKPRRKNAKPLYAVVSYFRTQKGVHDAEPGWWEQFTEEDVDVVRWQYITPAAQASTDRPLTRCAAGRDGDCTHAQCPQLRDSEPAKTGRHCPLDNDSKED